MPTMDPASKGLGNEALPPIPAKRYFTIGEVSELCCVKPHVLRYWEQEFTQLKPVKRRGNRRYYQHHEVLLVRRIRELLYNEGFTISGARNRLADMPSVAQPTQPGPPAAARPAAEERSPELAGLRTDQRSELRAELLDIARLLTRAETPGEEKNAGSS